MKLKDALKISTAIALIAAACLITYLSFRNPSPPATSPATTTPARGPVQAVPPGK